MSRKRTGSKPSDGKGVKTAMELAMEKAAILEDEPIPIQTEHGEVSMTFEEIKEKAANADEYLRNLQYKQAEFENYRKRTQKEKEDLLKQMIAAEDLFEVLEHLDRALESTGDEQAIRAGVQLIRAQMWNLLERKGIERIPAVGEEFDPNFHEAILEQPDGKVPAGGIAAEYRPGYKIGEKVIRPSQVVVSSGPPTENK